MKQRYDLLFITHLPAFYKVNLYNKIARNQRVFVIFVSQASSIRTSDFTQGDINFDYCVLNQVAFEKRNVIFSLVQLYKRLQSLSYKKLIVGGWELPEFWLAIFCSKFEQNQLALESSVFESAVSGFRAWIKKLFLSRISLAYPSGAPHQALLSALKFQGKSKTTLGVGIFNYQTRTLLKKSFSGKFLYVGRLAPEKNLEMLLNVFAQLPHFTLTLVGQGPLESELRNKASTNVKMLGHISNHELAALYESHDVLVLPSKREPWGLVVEEALFHGLPVIVSDKVGCAQDLVVAQRVGTSFEAENPYALTSALHWMRQHFDDCVNHIHQLDFAQKEAHQIKQYIEALS